MTMTDKAPSPAEIRFKQFIEETFLEHPRSVNETYLQHLWFSLKYGTLLLWTGIAFIIHGLIPACHQTTASTTVCKIYDMFKGRMALCDKNKTEV